MLDFGYARGGMSLVGLRRISRGICRFTGLVLAIDHLNPIQTCQSSPAISRMAISMPASTQLRNSSYCPVAARRTSSSLSLSLIDIVGPRLVDTEAPIFSFPLPGFGVVPFSFTRTPGLGVCFFAGGFPSSSLEIEI
jgi:hypothetical protein